MKSVLTIPLCSIALVACASQSEPTHQATTREAGLELSAATAALEAVQSRALSGTQSFVAPDTVQVNYLGPCDGGGSAAIAGSYDYSTSSADSAWDLDARFSGCTDSDGVLDGTLHWTQTVSGTAVAQALTGTLSWVGTQGSASCAFDVTIAVDATGEHDHGTVCGYDVSVDYGH